MKNEMKAYNLKEPTFINRNNSFKVIFYNEILNKINSDIKTQRIKKKTDDDILEFCSIPRSRQELKNFFNTKSNSIFSKRILPLVKSNKLEYGNPDHPKSPK